MALPLQRAPLGLLGAFELKSTGANPSFFGETVTPVVSVDNFYYQAANINDAVNAAAIVDGTLLTIRVPADEAWLVYALSGALGLAAGDQILDEFALHLGFRSTPFSPGTVLEQGPLYAPRVIVAATTLRVAHSFDRAMFIPPNADLTVTCGGSITILAARALVVSAHAYRFAL